MLRTDRGQLDLWRPRGPGEVDACSASLRVTPALWTSVVADQQGRRTNTGCPPVERSLSLTESRAPSCRYGRSTTIRSAPERFADRTAQNDGRRKAPVRHRATQERTHSRDRSTALACPRATEPTCKIAAARRTRPAPNGASASEEWPPCVRRTTGLGAPPSGPTRRRRGGVGAAPRSRPRLHSPRNVTNWPSAGRA